MTRCTLEVHSPGAALHSTRVLLPEIILHECAIPFIYGDIYHSCTEVHSDFDWCSLDHVFRGRWRYCTASDPPKCTFPFTFKERTFENCTKDDYVLDRSWCSLTSNYNTDRKWKQCPLCSKAVRKGGIGVFSNPQHESPLDSVGGGTPEDLP
uniref:Fibronectin type-II domain-containing protein n=1 Tax=Marmota marmota marmota TaxID=9994 RepID=A0A8C6ETH6_MARMA